MMSARINLAAIVCLLAFCQSAGGAWQLQYEENFEALDVVHRGGWRPDQLPVDGPFSDNDPFFDAKPPAAYRLSTPVGRHGWLTAESYSRDKTTSPERLLEIVADPADPNNHVLRLHSLAHSDASIVRSSAPLPARYRISLRAGFADFGNAEGLNGYQGGEYAGPWDDNSAVKENGFYWLTILDTIPRPRNNVWIHHHRKVVIDSDNHYPPWMRIWNGSEFIKSGKHPVMMFAIDGRQQANPRHGKPFISYSAGDWQPSGKIRAVDRYRPGHWYQVSIERSEHAYTLSITGNFEFGGQQHYRASIDYRRACVWHYNQPGEKLDPDCARDGARVWDGWQPGRGWPDYFFFGDPHINYYRGEVLYDGIRLEVWVED
jgi:hypothetical protein